MLKILRHYIGLLLIGIACVVLIWSVWQYPRQIKRLPLNLGDIQGFDAEINNHVVLEPGIVEAPASTRIAGNSEKSTPISSYEVILDYPTKIRTGESDTIRLDIVKDIPQNSHSSTEPHPNQGEISSQAMARFLTQYNILVETRLDLAGLKYSPVGDVIMPLQTNRELTLYWTVQSDKSGIYQGKMWLHLQFVAKDGSGTTRKLISTQLIELTAMSFCGLRGDIARLLGSIGFFMGLAFELDFIIGMIRKVTKGKRTHA